MENITAVLGFDVVRSKWCDEKKLPYFLRTEYSFEEVAIGGCRCLFIKPKAELARINSIIKHLKKIHEICPLPIVFDFETITWYRCKTFIEEKIPFVTKRNQLYLPFMGIWFNEHFENEQAHLSVLEKLLPSAQMLLFELIYNDNQPLYISEVTKKFNFSAMTLSRAAMQLVSLELVSTEKSGNQKIVKSELTPKELFEKATPYLINPVRKTLYIEKEALDNSMFQSGMSELAELSMLNPPALACYGTIEPIKDKSGISAILIDVEKQCMLELWKYDARLIGDSKKVDVLSLAVCFSEDNDERIMQAVEELKEKVWDK